jgi:hypothetical protein
VLTTENLVLTLFTKSIIKKATWLDLPLRYAPYNDQTNIDKKLLKWT